MQPFKAQSFEAQMGNSGRPAPVVRYRRMDMDGYEYNEENLSMVAGSCKYLSYKQPRRSLDIGSGVSCADCKSWTGTGCKRRQYDNIASELRLD